MRMLDLFAGIGGISLAAQWAGIETAAFCEIEPYCQQVLGRHWPTVPIYNDVRVITREQLERDGVIDGDRTIDIVAGGFPCQPFSVAGKRKGEADDRHLWPEMARVISDIRPRWVVGENVTGIVKLALDDVLADLESEGYTCRAFILPAAAVGAPHRRDRVFIVGHANHKRQERHRSRRIKVLETRQKEKSFKGTSKERPGAAQSRMGGISNGISSWMDRHRWPAGLGLPQYDWEPPRVATGVKDRSARLKALGNAVVPQQIYPILKAIREAEGRREG